tara:strand:- start:976 stop:1494 length:519 start_codon:yes stop_codon:yes gene_type:complete
MFYAPRLNFTDEEYKKYQEFLKKDIPNIKPIPETCNPPLNKWEDINKGDSIDAHCWIVLEDGTIMDYPFEEYNLIKKLNGCEGDLQYKEFDDDLQKKCYKWSMDNYWKPIGNDELSIKLFKFGNCVINVWVVYKDLMRNPKWNEVKLMKPKIVFGSLGFKKINSQEIWWEYG